MNVISPMFSVFDRASQSFMPPFAAPHSGVAIRGFTDAVHARDKSTDISKHPDDFDLFEVASFDSSAGVIIPLPSGNKLIIQGKQVALQSELSV